MKMLPFLLMLLSAASAATAAEPTPPALPLPVASFGATATKDGSVYIYGGHSGARHQYNRDDVHGGLFRWRQGQAEWEKLSEDEPAQGASLLAHGNEVLRVGGMAARNAKGDRQDLWSSGTAARYDAAEKRWLPLPELPARRSSHDSVLVGDQLYVIGGWAMIGGRKVEWHEDYLTLDLSKEGAQWQAHRQPFKRRALAVAALDRKIYAIGGMDSDNEITAAVSVLDTQTGQWREGPPLPEDKLGGFGFAALSHEGRLYASGAPGVLLELRNGLEWVAVGKLKYPRFFHRLVAGGPGLLIALGGESREGEKAPPEVLTPNAEPHSERNTYSGAGARISATTGATAGSDWPRYQGPRGDSTTPEVGWNKAWPADGPPVLWQAELGKGLGSLAVVGQRVYGAGNDGADRDILSCLDLETGLLKWRHEYPAVTRIHEMSIVPYGPATTPTVMNGRAWFISRDGQVICLEAETGKLAWQKHLVDDLGGKRPVYGYAASPAIHEGRLYLDTGGSGKSNTCLDGMSGEVVWQTGDGEAGYSTPIVRQIQGAETLILFKGEALELRSPQDGRLLARHATQTRDFCNCATPVVSGGLFFISHTATWERGCWSGSKGT